MHEWFLAKQKITNKAAANKCKIYCCRYLVCYCCNKPIALLLICFSCYYCSCCFCSCCCCCCNYVGIGTFGSYPQFFILFDYFACIFRPCLFFLRFTLCRLLLIVVIVTLDSSELVSQFIARLRNSTLCLHLIANASNLKTKKNKYRKRKTNCKIINHTRLPSYIKQN